jgi:hypothetical protein
MNDILLILHFFGLGAGFAAAVGSPIIGRQAAASPDAAPVLGKAQEVLARTGQIGLGLLWLTGLAMIWTVYGGPAGVPALFWFKFACVVVVTGAVIMLRILGQRARAGDAAARSQMPIYGAVSGVFLILVVIFAVLAFN